MIVPVILAGGSGSRLWPLSRSLYPKQFLPFISHRTLFQETVLRVQAIPDVAPPFIICHHEHRFLVAEQLKQIGIQQATIVLEPVAKNTAPAAAIAALYYAKHHANPELLILPADHAMQDNAAFIEAVLKGAQHAAKDYMVTFGVKPLRAETGYGYIKAATEKADNHAYPIIQFVEKPDIKTAETYLASSDYYWNSGMFMFQASCFLKELKQHAPAILQACQQAMDAVMSDLDFIRLNADLMAACPHDSIDYAIMERTQRAVMVPLTAGWSDVGSWASLWEVQPHDENGCVVQGDVLTAHVENSYLRAESRLLAVVGLRDHIVIETPDAVLVAHKEYSQSLKDIVAQLSQKRRPEIQTHRRVYRPWGYYETIDQGSGFQVKRIGVNLGASLSLQLHKYRSEHWVVISGIAKVTRGDEIFTIQANESTYIPQGVKHRLENVGDTLLEIIEVQSGSYLGEDDIIRFDDKYGRTSESLPS